MGNINKDNMLYMAKYSAFNPYRMREREMGYNCSIGSSDALAKSLYCGMKPIATWDSDREKAPPTGGIFNLEFSPEGTLLVAACEKKSIQIFDPLTHERIHAVNGAHTDCVNCVKFLDARMFATCSDDTTIALWDVRNLKKKIRTLLGHSKWVKNIEFSVKDKLLVTSGLDGSIYTWDINSYTEYNLVYQRVFHTSSLMRCRLSPDAKQMVLCTTGGLIVIIHDLNLSTLAQDLHGFKPNLYRLMQMSHQMIPVAAMYDHLFDSKNRENRVEFVSDFPEGNDAEVVSALQIHPQGWSALSRNISHDDKSEWTCIHDIQPIASPGDKDTRDTRDTSPVGRGRRPPSRRSRPRVYRVPRPMHPNPMSAEFPSTSGYTPSPDSPYTSDEEPATKHFIRQNKNRLLYYIEETNEGKGFIKELCFSADGRIVCSPFGRGMRLLALNSDCGELSSCVEDLTQPRVMVELGQSLGIHTDLVVSSKFSPRYHMLVTGCLEGKIVWYQPFSGEAV
ncbi:DDB1- and CUL4-associated factor 10 homolog isoform X3 [Trichoplusia ni]|uniref:DDB1- and CUL4-associated factor 10 homolog isoform X3 n=1 Tax=Trichoplusia ni TaxID=7111 RepID=A0A7E5WSS0_TRINI|nr:DDB1- and CUL4-associated factor 10 homolog isoform X3 [Trichoplusia ni]